MVECLEDRLMPTTWTVNTLVDIATGSSTSGALRYCVTHAVNGDSINFTNGLSGTITLGSVLTISHNLTITGPGASALAISGNNAYEVFAIPSGVTTSLSSLTIKNGHANSGGGINNNGTLTLTGDTISGNTAPVVGGGIDNTGSLTVSNCTISGNTCSSHGGGIWNSGSLTLTSDIISANKATYNGGGIFNTSVMTLTNCTLSSNSVGNAGGGLWNGSNVTVSLNNTTLSGNSAAFGGGIYNASGTVTLTNNSTVSNNTATNNGGGINNSATVSLINSTLSGNTAPYGGGVFNYSGTVTLTNNSTVTQNTATNNGGGIDNNTSATLSISNSIISNNSAPRGGGIVSYGPATLTSVSLSANSGNYGGGIDNFGPLTVNNSTISSNRALSSGGGIWNGNNATVSLSTTTLSGNSAPYGGGIYNNAGTVTLTNNSTVSSNTAMNNGGGIDNNTGATLTVANSTVSGNMASLGGGIFNLGLLMANSSTINANSATKSGAGIDNNGTVGTVSLSNCTINGNSAPSAGGLNNNGTMTLSDCTLYGNTASTTSGGGIWSDGSLTLTNCTVSHNSALQAGGGINIVNDNQNLIATLTLLNTIVAGNAAGTGPDIGGTILLANHDLIGNTSGTTISSGTGNLTGNSINPLNPQLAPLADYGGPTQTMALLANSPAINAGVSGTVSGVTIPTTDQRGFGRVGAVDIGAFEYNSATPLVVNSTADGGAALGTLDLRGAIDLANVLAAAVTINFDSTVFSTPQTITLTGGVLSLTNSSLTTINGTSGLTVSANKASGVFQIASGASAAIQNITITNGSALLGGGIDNTGSLTVSNCTISGNTCSSHGGGIWNSGSLTLSSDIISANKATYNGGGIFNTGTAVLTSCTVNGNSVGNAGGGLWNGNNNFTVSLNNSTLSGNSAGYGGGIYNYTGTVTLTNNSTLSNNTATYNGGGINNSATVSLSNSTLSGNSAQEGGGILSFGSAMLTSVSLSSNSGQYGGGIESFGPLTVTNSTFSNNRASSSGGGIWNGGNATVSLSTTTLSGNSAPYGGGIYNYTGSVTLTNCTVSNNTAMNHGGGIDNDATLTLSNSMVSGDTAPYGGGIFNYSGTVTLTNNSTVTQNTATNNGGGIDNNTSATLSISNSIISNNSAPRGGGIVSYGPATLTSVSLSANSGNYGGGIDNFGPLTVNNSTISSNRALSSGGGIWNGNNATVSLSTTTLSGNSAPYGGGIYNNAGNVTLTNNSTVSSNTAMNNGGGIDNNTGATLTVANSTVSGNMASLGGGIFNLGLLMANSSTINANSATKSGAGIDNNGTVGTVSLSNCTINGNSAPSAGGLNNNGTMTLSNCTISGNMASATSGGGIWSDDTLTLTNCTVSQNSAFMEGGGIENDNATLNLTNTIVAGNTASTGPDVGGTVTLGNHDLIGNTSGTTISGTGNLTGNSTNPLDPQLAPLANNGGATQTMALLTGSAAILAGDPAQAGSTAQNGITRPSAPDIGAYQTPLPPSIAAVFNSSFVALQGTSSLTFTLTNPTANNVALTGVGFTDVLPAGLTVVNGTSSQGGGTLTLSGGNTITLSGATIATGDQLVFSVTATGAAAGGFTDTTGTVSASNTAPGSAASASLTVVAPPSIAAAFNASSITQNGMDTLTFTLTNPTANTVTETGVGFSDVLPAGLTVVNGSSSQGGGTLTLSGGNTITLSGATIAVQGTLSFSVTVTGATPGAYLNTTGTVSSINGGTGNAASASLTVAPAPATTTTLTDNGPNPSLSGSVVSFVVGVASVNPISGETVSIEDSSNGNAVVATPMLTNGTATFTLSSLNTGTHDLFAVYSSDGTNPDSQSSQVTQTVQSTFGVNNVAVTPSGVVLTFNAPIDPNSTVLYSSPGDTVLGPADVTVVGTTTGAVRGSLVIDPTNPNVATFVQTSGLLAPDTYTVTVTPGVKAIGGSDLTGNYSTTLTVAPTTTPVLSVPSFARGPGQAVQLTDSLNNDIGIPITISNATNVTQASFSLTYDPLLLTIGSSTTASLPAAASAAGLTIESYVIAPVDATHSILSVTLSGGTGFTATTAAPLLTLAASVPTTAPYLDKALLNLSNVMVNATTATGVASVSVVAFPGDVLGTGVPNATDASLVDQVGSGSGSGFSEFKDLDPVIIGGAEGGLFLNANDASLIDEAASGATISQIPSIPVGVSLTFGGPDPYLYLSTAQGSAGQTVTETLYLDVTDPNGIQLTALDEAIGFDANVLQISEVRGTSALAALGSYETASTVDNGSGEFLVAQAFMGTGLPPVVPYGTDIPVLQFNVTLNTDMGVGSEAGLTLLQYGTVNGEAQYTAVSDNKGALTWTPGKARATAATRLWMEP